MSKKQGFCTNCGSLITLDSSKEKGTCIFCQEEVDVAAALALNEDNERRELVQKEAYEKSLEEAKALKDSAKDKQTGFTRAAQGQNRDRAGQKVKAAKLEPMPKKTKLTLLVSIVAFIVIVAAILVPTTMDRNKKRDALDAAMDTAVAKINVEIDSKLYKYSNNREYFLSTKQGLAEGQAELLYDSYVKEYAELYSLDTEEVHKKIKFTVYDAAGIYEAEPGSGKLIFTEGSYRGGESESSDDVESKTETSADKSKETVSENESEETVSENESKGEENP